MKNNLWILFACIIFVTIVSSNELKKGGLGLEQTDSVRLAQASIDQRQISRTFLEINQYDSLFKQIAVGKELEWTWLKSIMIKESRGKGDLISSAGAVGLMQLMPRDGSFTDQNYRNYQAARKQKRQKDGLRYFEEKTEFFWAKVYRKSLDSLQKNFFGKALYEKDKRFDPNWNISEAARQLGSDYQFFKSRGHDSYKARILAFAAYHAGRYAVMKEKQNPAADHIPINQQTELYVAHVERIIVELKKGDGTIAQGNHWLLYL